MTTILVVTASSTCVNVSNWTQLETAVALSAANADASQAPVMGVIAARLSLHNWRLLRTSQRQALNLVMAVRLCHGVIGTCWQMMHFVVPTKIIFLPSRISTVFFSMKMAESKQIVLVFCIIDFDDVQV